MASENLSLLDTFTLLSNALNAHTSRSDASKEALQHKDRAVSLIRQLKVFVGDLATSPADCASPLAPSPSDILRPLSDQQLSAPVVSQSHRYDAQSAHALATLAGGQEATPSKSHARFQAPRKGLSTYGARKSEHERSPKLSLLEKMSSVWPKNRIDIESFMSQTASKATKDHIRQTAEDPRIADLKIAALPTQQAKFRRMLSQRWLAGDFVHWELDKGKVSKVDSLFKKLTKQPNANLELSSATPNSDARSKRGGYITEFLQWNGGFVDIAAARDGIDQGVKLLAFEKMYGQAAISSFLSFASSYFQRLPNSDIAQLVIDMKGIKWIDDLVNKKADWFVGCERKYNSTH